MKLMAFCFLLVFVLVFFFPLGYCVSFVSFFIPSSKGLFSALYFPLLAVVAGIEVLKEDEVFVW